MTMHEHGVQESHHVSRSALFGPFEVSLSTGELRKHGVKVRLQGKPFQILSALLEQPGSVVTREDLRARLWSTDTYVDFESGLNTAVNRLRAALSDSAEHPAYVETLSRIGYRFVAPVSFVQRPFAQTIATDENGRKPEVILAVDQPAPTANPFLAEAARPTRRNLRLLIYSVALSGALAGVAIWVSYTGRASTGSAFRQLTFATGEIHAARFTADGATVFYSASWNGKPPHIFSTDAKSGRTTDLGFEREELESVSPNKELAIFSDREKRLLIYTPGGKKVKQEPEQAIAVDWGSNGREWLLVRHGPDFAIESPPGHLLYVTPAWIDGFRVSRDGKQVAFLRHPILMDDAGDVVVLRLGSDARVVSANWGSVHGLAWSSDGSEVWFTAAVKGVQRQLMAANMKGSVRRIAEVPGGISLQDISASGDTLITRDATQVSMFRGDLHSRSLRDISWLDWPVSRAVSSDGQLVLFDETGDAGGKQYSTYVYDDRAHSDRMIGQGRALDLSDDGRWALTQPARTDNALELVSVQTGTSRNAAARNFSYRWVRFLPGDSLEAVVGGNYQQEDQGVFRQRLPDGTPSRVSDQTLYSPVVDPKGRLVAGVGAHHTISLIDLANGSARLLPNPNGLMPAGFVDGTELLTWRREAGSVELQKLNIETGATQPYAALPAGSVAIPEIFEFDLSHNLNNYACSGSKLLSTLFDVSSWR